MQYIFLIQHSLYCRLINFREFCELYAICENKNREITTLAKRMATQTNLSNLKKPPKSKEIKYCENI